MHCSNRCAPVHKTRRPGPIAILALLALAALPCSVSAGYSLSWQGSAYAGAGGLDKPVLDQTSYQFTYGGIYPLSHSLSVANDSSNGDAAAEVSGTADFGVLRATGDTHGMLSGIDPTQVKGTVYGSMGYATLSLKSVDNIIVVSLGKPESDGYVHLPWELKLDDIIDVTASTGTKSTEYDFSATGTRVSTSVYATDGNGAFAYAGFLEDTPKVQRGTQTISGVALVKPADTLQVSVSLLLSTEAVAFTGATDSIVVANHSAHFYLDPDPITGASYTTASGHTYFSPQVSAAPEPASLTLAGIGIGLAAAYGWCRRRPLGTSPWKCSNVFEEGLSR